MSICKPTGDKNLGRRKRSVHIEGKNSEGETVYLNQNLKWSIGIFSRGIITFDRACEVMDTVFYPDDYSGGNFDDAYAGGVEDGKAEMARSIIEILNS